MDTKIVTIKDFRLKQYKHKEIYWITDDPEVLEFARRLAVEGIIDKIEVKDFVEEDY
jgi:transcription initiation factor IIE alpha subunit